MVDTPLVSIIIPTRNGSKTIGKCLESICMLDHPDYEVIVVDDGSIDGTGAMVETFRSKITGLQLLRTSGVGPSAARNLAVDASTGAYIAFTDDDCIVDRHWLTELVSGFTAVVPGMDSARLAAVGGDQVSPEDETAFGRSVNEFLKAVGFVADYVKTGNVSGLRETGHNPTCNALYRRDVFTAVGKFKEGLWPGEDVEFDRRVSCAGYRLLYNPRAVVAHYRPNTMWKFARMMYRYGMAQAYLVRRYGFFRKIHAEPLLFWSYCVFVGVTIAHRVDAGWLIGGPLLAALALLMLRTGKPLKSVAYLCLFITTILAWNLGFTRAVADPGKKI